MIWGTLERIMIPFLAFARLPINRNRSILVRLLYRGSDANVAGIYVIFDALHESKKGYQSAEFFNASA